METRKVLQVETEEKQPEEYREDLNPNATAGQNIGLYGEHPEKEVGQSAYDRKEAHRMLPHLSADDLRELRILPAGTRLLEGAKYVDLKNLERGEVEGDATLTADDDHWFVPKKDVDYELWNRLLGLTDVRRTGTGG